MYIQIICQKCISMYVQFETICERVKTSLQYTENEIFIENKKVCVKLLRNRLETIQKLQPPKTYK